MGITDYNKRKNLSIDSVSGTPQVDKAQPLIISGEKSDPFDVSTASFTDGFDVSSQDDSPEDVAFNNAGDKMFVVGSGNDNVYEYSLSTSFDVSTASFTDSFDVSSQDDRPRDVTFNDTGDKMFVVGALSEAVFEYSLSTSFDVSTASFTQSFLVSSQDDFPEGVAFNDAGDKMFVVGNRNNKVYEYSLSTSFNVNTASFTDSFDVSSQDERPRGVAFNDTGDKMFVAGNNNDNIYEYSLSFNFDVSTASFTDSFDVLSQDDFSEGVAFSDTGDKMFVAGSGNDSVYEYSLGTDDSKTGNGDIVIDFNNVSGAEDIAVYDQNNNLLDYEIESLDTSAETGVLWAYNSWVRDGTTQAQLAYGDNSANTDRQNVTATWNNTPQNAEAVYHLDGDAIDSSGNFKDMTINGATTTSTSQLDGGLSFDGTDDDVETSDSSSPPAPFTDTNSSYTVVLSAKADSGADFDVMWYAQDPSTDARHGLTVNSANSNDVGTDILSSDSQVAQSGFDLGAAGLSVTNFHNYAVEFDGNSSMEVFVDAATDGSSINANDTGNGQPFGLRLGIYTQDGGGQPHFPGVMSFWAAFSEQKGSTWHQAHHDSTPAGGQVFFSQQSSSPPTSFSAVDISEAFTLTAAVSADLAADISESLTLNAPVSTRLAADISESLTLNALVSTRLAADLSEAFTLKASVSADSAAKTGTSYLQTDNRQVDFSLERTYFQEDSSVLNFELKKGNELVKQVNISQFLSALDDVSAAFEVENVISESLTPGASISKTTKLTQDVSASFDDSANVLFSKLVPEFVSPSDSFTKSASKSLNQSLNLSDFKRLSAAQNISESFETDDTASVTHNAVRFFDETVLTADTSSLFYQDFVDESLSATSFVATLQDAERSLTQGITPGDSDIRGINQKIGEFIDAEPFVRRSTGKSLSESLAAGDFSQFELVVSLSQAAGVNDDASEFLRSSLPQPISVADAESRVFAGSRNLQQGFDLSVSVNAFNSVFETLTESVSFLDSQSVTRDFSRTIFQEEEVGADAQKLFGRGVSESAAASDVETVLFRDLLSESQLVSDSEVVSVSLNQEQDLSVEDDFLSSSVLLRAFNQDFQVVASQSSLASQRLLESVPLVDAVFDAFSFEKFRSASEEVAVSSDSVVSLRRVLSEDSAVADVVRFDSELFRRFEPVVLFDSFLKASQALSLAEVQRVSDAARKSFSSGLSEAAAVSDALTTKLPSSVIPAVADLSALRVAVAELSKPRGAFTDSESKP